MPLVPLGFWPHQGRAPAFPDVLTNRPAMIPVAGAALRLSARPDAATSALSWRFGGPASRRLQKWRCTVVTEGNSLGNIAHWHRVARTCRTASQTRRMLVRRRHWSLSSRIACQRQPFEAEAIRVQHFPVAASVARLRSLQAHGPDLQPFRASAGRPPPSAAAVKC